MAPKRKAPAKNPTSKAKRPTSSNRESRKEDSDPKTMSQLFNAFRCFIDDFEQRIANRSPRSSPSPSFIPDTAPDPSSLDGELPGTSASLFNESQFASPSTQAMLSANQPPETRARSRMAHTLSAAARASGRSASAPPNNMSMSQSSSLLQSLQPGVQLPESGISDGEELQLQASDKQQPTTTDKPAGKRRSKKKHVYEKSRSRDTDEESDELLPLSIFGPAAAGTFLGPPLEHWKCEVIKGVLASLEPSTLRLYKKAWCDFLDFRSKVSALARNIPPTTDHVLHYLAHLHMLGLAAETIRMHSAAISFFSQFIFSADPCADFIVHMAIKGWGRLQPAKGKPITFDLFCLIRQKLRSICWSKYEARLFSAAFSIAAFGALSVGEVVFEAQPDGSSCGLHLNDIQLSDSELIICIQRSKTDQQGKGVPIRLSASENQGPCPVKDTRRYLYLRPPGRGPLLIHEDGSCLKRHQFTQVLRKAIDACGFPAEEYAADSFRIGAAAMAGPLGHPTNRIRNALKWYI
ncbi:uncharacterized protein LOC144327460 [Podarcis muralis]